MRGLLHNRRMFIVLSQGVLIALTYYVSFLLRLDYPLDKPAQMLFWNSLPVVLGVKLVLFYYFGLLSGWWRYVGMSDLLDISKAAFTGSTALYVLIEYALRLRGYPRSVIAIDFLLTVVVIGGARFAVRAYTENAQGYAARRNTLIVGAGRVGSNIVRELKQNPTLDYKPIGFVDDNPSKIGIKIHGVKVLGNSDNLESLITSYGVRCVLFALPRVGGKDIERIITKCRECDVDFKILPNHNNHIEGGSKLNQLRNVQVEDLLGRKPVRLELDKIREKLEGKVLLITGAGGSIGSELARQVATFNPRKLILFERSENDLFKISSELTRSFPRLKSVPAIGDILNVGVLRDVFSLHRPNSVFHAAAYKHVPMMETNCFQAVTNNIFGTYNVAVIAQQYQTEDFVMISSDKAVNPTNIMGVTKRVAELIILGLWRQDTRFIAVRFGNVLGSNGSVVPIFQEQIARGGPVTVTHPDAMRYFMTIPEAVQLVLQASSMGNGREIFVLEMGEQVRITDLAKNLIRLSGLVPDRDVQVVFTGLRPGEKLQEELMFEGEGLKSTSHEKIRVLDGGESNFEQVRGWLDVLSELVEAKNVNGLIEQLIAIVPEYAPSREVLALCGIDRHDMGWRYMRQSAGLEIVPTSEAA